jgi:hypothetical protein
MPYAPNPGDGALTAKRLTFEADRGSRSCGRLCHQGLNFDITGVRFDDDLVEVGRGGGVHRLQAGIIELP